MSDSLDVSPAALRDLTWEQGSLFPEAIALPTIFWAHERTQAHSTAQKAVANAKRQREVTDPQMVSRMPKQGDRLAVITQTCDILKSADLSPLVDVARVFATAKPAVIAEASNFGSARYFRLTPVGASPTLVLDFTWHGQVDKGFLVEHPPDNTIVNAWTKEQREAFARWLGRRYSRPVLSDEDVAKISDPLRERWSRFVEDETELAQQCSEQYSEFRFRYAGDGTLQVLVLSPLQEPDEALGFEVAAIIKEALDPHHPAVEVDPGTYWNFSLAEYLTTEQIDLEWASHDEGEASGALPGS